MCVSLKCCTSWNGSNAFSHRISTLQRESTRMPDMDVNLRLTRPQRRAAFKSQQASTMPNRQKQKDISVRSSPHVDALPVDDEMAIDEQ